MAKKLKIKLPKRIAGMRIPKSVRRGPVTGFLNSSGGQLMIAEALLAVGAMYAARRFDRHTSVGDALRHPLDNLRAGREWSHGATDRLTQAFSAGVKAFRASLHEQSNVGADSSSDATAEGGDGAMDADATAKRQSPRSGSSSREPGAGRH